ncbi:MAG: hypothetical protein HYY02_07215 [Chloroflexi bacterium]|nr:hypothetical protein [Chloroflexota bacterium]
MADLFQDLSPELFARLAEPDQPGVELDSIREVLRMYARALTGINIQVMTSDELYNKGLAWVSLEAQELGGGAVLLPDVVDAWPTPEENFLVYKVLATHQAAHLEQGTLRFSFERPATLLPDLRPHLLPLLPPEDAEARDFRRYFGLFSHRKLASDVFNLLEDFRVDGYLAREYRGIRSVRRRVLLGSLSVRPHLEVLPLREAAAEVLFRYAVGAGADYAVPRAYLPQVRQAAGLMNLLADPAATVEDAAEAALRAYCLLRQVPNLPASSYPQDLYERTDLSSARYDPAEEDSAFWLQELQRLNTGGPRRRRGDPIDGPGQVVYKGIPSSPFQQHLSFETEGPGLPRDLTLDDLDQALAEERLWIEVEEQVQQILEQALERPQPPPGAEEEVVDTHELLEGRPPEDDLLGALLRPREEEDTLPGSGMDRDMCQGEALPFVYPEWDSRQEEYRPDWCTLWQRQLREGDPDFFRQTLEHYHPLVSAVEKRFEALRPELFHRQRGLVDGDDIDLDRLVAAHVEMRAAGYIDDKIYQRRDKLERSVSILFLLDMSISTSESADLSRRALANAGWGAFGSPEYKRIIDVEKESLVVLTRALEKVGDRYGIYGFSGRGRDGARFYVVKDMAEPLSEAVMARIDTIAPVQATRMGPAIRHATTILDREPSRTRILVLISDGQPQDLDYGSEAEGGRAPLTKQSLAEQREQEKEYAVSDTHKALAEARARGIVPYLLSIDRHGYDYLRIMCGDFGYEVVPDIRLLPRRLVSLYNLLAR